MPCVLAPVAELSLRSKSDLVMVVKNVPTCSQTQRHQGTVLAERKKNHQEKGFRSRLQKPCRYFAAVCGCTTVLHISIHGRALYFFFAALPSLPLPSALSFAAACLHACDQWVSKPRTCQLACRIHFVTDKQCGKCSCVVVGQAHTH